MAELKKQFKKVSGWLKYNLETDLLDPPVIKLRVTPLNKMLKVESYNAAGEIKPVTKLIIGFVLGSVWDWDLTQKGKKIPITEENKRGCLVPLLGEKVEGKDKDLLGFEVFNYVSDYDNFLQKDKTKPKTKPRKSKKES